MRKFSTQKKPLVYSCSGCSSAAQMTNYLALQLDRKGIAEMSCIAGLGGNVKSLVHKANSGQEIIVIDGCPLACSLSCLRNHYLEPALHIDLSSLGVKKKMHADFDTDEANRILAVLEESITKGREKLAVRSELEKITRQVQAELSGIIVKEVSSKQEMNEFIGFPIHLYRNNKFYVPQLNKDVKANFDKNKNPAFEFCEARYWLAYKNNRVVGRVAGIINHHAIKTWGSYARFGWIDFIYDEAVAFALLNKVESWAKEKGMTGIHGPLGFSNFDYAGMLTDGFNETGTFATIYNYPYYPRLLEKAGYKKERGWLEFMIKVPHQVPLNLLKAASIVERRFHLEVVRPKKREDILPYTNSIFELINSCYAGLFGMTALTQKQIEYNARKYFSFIKPEFVSLVLDSKKHLVAFGITMPSLSNALQKTKGKLYPLGVFHLLKAFRKNNMADLCMVAVRKDLQGKGFNAIIMREITESFIRQGIQYAESNPELEDNNKVQSLWDYFESRQHKKRSCFVKKL